METELCAAHAVLREEYRTLVRADATIAIPRENEAMRRFYGQMIQTAVRWAEEVEGARQRAAYLALSDIWERSRFRPSVLRLSGSAREIDDRFLAVVCDLTLTRGDGGGEHRRSAQVWNPAENTFLPEKEILRRWFGGKKAGDFGYRADGCYPENGGVVFFRNPHRGEPFSEIRKEIEKYLTKSQKNKEKGLQSE